MKKSLLFLLAIGVIWLVFFSSDSLPERVCIDYVIDGDTVVLENGEKIRIAGIDTPEMYSSISPEKGAIKAKEEAEKLLEDRCLSIELKESQVTGENRGKYGRFIADFYLPQKDIMFSEYMLENNYAEKF